MAQYVNSLTAEDEDELIVAFVMDEYAHRSLTLLRTPKDESLLPDEERGVSLYAAEEGNGAPELLQSLIWGPSLVKINSAAGEYMLDVSAVDAGEIQQAKQVLLKMNFDKRFRLNIV